MNCCNYCFEDHVIKSIINEQKLVGDCDYCGRDDTYTISIKELVFYFENLMVLYEITTHGEHFIHYEHCPTEFGDPLVDLIQEDWQVFSDDTSHQELLFDILNYHNGYENRLDPQNLYSRSSSAFTYVSSSDIWDEFSNSIKKENRFFLGINVTSTLANILSQKKKSLSPSDILYRARIGKCLITEMGPPPREKASPGRANPRGIVYLYGASNIPTCISEIRPWKSVEVTVCELKPKRNLNLIDLSFNIDTLTSPFIVDNIKEYLDTRELLLCLAEELSKPVNPYDAEIEYLPSQYLAELIKHEKYDGLMFKSSIGSGYNYVIFNPDSVEYISVSNYQINEIDYKYSIKIK